MKPLLLSAFAALQVADVWTTHAVLAAGGWEGNPAMAWLIGWAPDWWEIPKLAIMAGCAAFMTRWPVRWIAGAVVLMAAVVLSNVAQI